MTNNRLTDERINNLLRQFNDEGFNDTTDDELMAALQEIQAYRKASGKPAMVVPDGYVMVPAKANTVMIRAGAKAAREYLEEYGGNSPQVIYQAMVAAALLQEGM